MGTRRVRVMHVLSSFTTGGAEMNTTRLVASLSERGFDQIVVSLTPEVHANVASQLAVPLLHPERSRRLVGSIAYLTGIAREFSPDLIHGRAYRSWPECSAAKLFARHTPKLLQSFHGATSLDIEQWRRKFMACGLRTLADSFIAVSDDLARRVVEQWRLPADRVEVIPNGVDLNHFTPAADNRALRASLGISPGAFVIGSVGSLREVKNPGFLIRAFSEFDRQVEDAVLLIVGDGDLRTELETLGRELGVSRRILFCGRQTNVRDHIVAMDLFVQPSFKEGSPTAVLEALACGVPAIAARSSGCVELQQRTGVPLLVDGQDDTALAEQLLRLHGDGRRRAALGRRSREVVAESFSFERMINSYERVYRRLISSERPVIAGAVE
jgi:glycosyltransferase involved in cell wall biosynthesis